MNAMYEKPLLRCDFAFYTICSNHKNRRLTAPQIAMSELKLRLSDLELRPVNGVIVGFEPEPVALTPCVSVSVVPPMIVPPTAVPPIVVLSTVVPPIVVAPTSEPLTVDPPTAVPPMTLG